MTHDRDERLAELVNQLSEQARTHGVAEVDAVAVRHPDLAGELRELWAIAQFAELAKPGQSTIQRPTTNERPSAELPQPNQLPRAFGEFELRRELGRGGMGVVYDAYQKSLNRTVAIKLVRESHLEGDMQRSRFRTEAESAARLQHPNIATVYEVGNQDGQAFLCMEYVAGRTLSQHLATEGPFLPRDAARIVAEIARAMHYAHSQGVLHRDLKPSNILLQVKDPSSGDHPSDGSTFTPKIVDFGLAKQTDQVESLTRSGAVVGTPSYMSPEQAMGRRDVTAIADVYSLGAILYEMLTGRPPFRASNPVDTLLMVLEQEPVSPRKLNPSVDRDLELICLKCLQKPQDLRYGSAAELAADLEAYRMGEKLTVQSGNLGSFVSRLLRETHHAAVLENWGLLWILHSIVIFVICIITQVMAWSHLDHWMYYLAVWSTGLFTWSVIFWRLRRRGGPVLFVERQIAHAWAGAMCASIALFVIEVVQGLKPLTLSPVLAVIAGMVFFVKAGTLSGQFYLSVIAYFITAGIMAAFPGIGHLVFGLVSALSFFLPGWKYYHQRRRTAERISQMGA